MWSRVSLTAICFAILAICLMKPGEFAIAQQPVDDAAAQLRLEVATAARKAAEFYRGSVAVHGGYVYYYSLDLQHRLGEGDASPDQIWVQPPGTPTIGLAYLRAYAATGDDFYLEAATEAAEALVYGQLQSGGWTNAIDFNPAGKRTSLYRNGKGQGRNYSTLDDGITQGALQLLMNVDLAHEFKNSGIHEATRIALDALLAAQFANGAFPQVWMGPVEHDKPLLRANYPTYDWRSEGRIKNYWDMYTLNDGLAGSVAETLIDAHGIYEASRYEQSLRKLGDFLILAQMPEPQPAWAQQYNDAMQPIWARKFEPPAITGGESQDVLETLLKIYRHTGDPKYLQPIPAALIYLKRSLLPDGQLARYYELQSNRPLYMTKKYELTYTDADIPSHYGWKVASRLPAIEREYRRLTSDEPPLAATAVADPAVQARAVMQQLDEQGRWISTYDGARLVGQPKFQPGAKFLSSAVFSRNLAILSRYLQAAP